MQPGLSPPTLWLAFPLRKRSCLLSWTAISLPQSGSVSCVLFSPEASSGADQSLTSTLLLSLCCFHGTVLTTELLGKSPSFQTWCSPDPGLRRVWQMLEVVRGGYTSYSFWMSGCLFLSDMKLQQPLGGGGGHGGRGVIWRLTAVPVIHCRGEKYEENRLGNWKRLTHGNWNT